VYSLTNTNVPAQTVYYRIRSVDIDGRAKYSGVLKLPETSSTSYSDEMIIYPMPAQDQVTIAHKKMTWGAKLTITTIDGKVIKNVMVADGSSHTPVSLTGMTSGLYFVRLEDQNGKVQVAKLLKN